MPYDITDAKENIEELQMVYNSLIKQLQEKGVIDKTKEEKKKEVK